MSQTASSMAIPQRTSSRQDYRLLTAAALIAVIVGLGTLVKLFPSRGIEASEQPANSERSAFAGLRAAPTESQTPRPEAADAAKPGAQGDESGAGELDRALKQAESLIAAHRYDDAIQAINRVRPLAGNSAQAYRQLGHALQGKGDYAAARDFYTKAIDLDPTLAEAYFDHATASESLGDLESALGGMRSFLHLVKNPDPYRLQVAQARSAIWEWEAKLGRGPWGPTKGIPPGFTADELKRDGRGTAVKIPRPETLRPDGTMDYEIKTGERFPNLWKK